MTNKVLLTRSEEENKDLALLLKEKGYQACSINFISYKALTGWQEVASKSDILVITSKFAAKLVADEGFKDKEIYVVGKGSAIILKGNNLKVFKSASELFLNLPQDNSSILYLCGNYLAVTPPSFLKKVEIYNTDYLKYFTNQEKEFIIESQYLLFYSKKVAEVFLMLCTEYNLLQYVKESVVITLSSRIAECFKDYGIRAIYTDSSSDDMLRILFENGKG